MNTLALEPGVVVDRYVIEDTLGQGGMAVVYKVRHRTLGSAHALKILTVHGAAVRDRLIREGRVQASLTDPNIVAVTDVIDVNGSPGLIMQYVDGPSLGDWLGTHRPDLPEAERIFEGILSALELAHSRGVVHRDLKPANVLLTTSGGRLVPRVADFGLAKALHEEGATGQTRAGALMGTPSYMAPEQIRDASTTDHRGDIFALGCILYELVCGQVAFQGEHYLDVFDVIRAGKYARPSAVRPDLPARLDMAIRGALIIDRQKRIPDCATLRAVMTGKRRWELTDEGVQAVGLTLGPSDGSTDTIGPVSFFDERDPTDEKVASGNAPAPAVDARPGEPARVGGQAAAEPTAAQPTAGTHNAGAPTGAGLTAAATGAVSAAASAAAAPGSASPGLTAAAPQGAGQGPVDASVPRVPAPGSSARPGWVLPTGGLVAVALAALVWRLAVGSPAETTPAEGPTPSQTGPTGDGQAGADKRAADKAAADKLAADQAAADKLAADKLAADKAAADKAAADKAAADKLAADKAAADKLAADKARGAGGTPGAGSSVDPARPAATARFSFTGADDVRLVNASGSYRPGPLPPGDYTIKATFGGATNTAGSLTLTAGQSVALHCDADFATCER